MSKNTIGLLLTIGLLFIFNSTAYAGEYKPVPVVSQFKTFMDYHTITNHTSEQWKLQTQAQTDANGLRVVNGRYLIAVGSYFTHDVGESVNVYMDTGEVIPCVVGDAKADCDTINGHSTGTHNDAVEFIVDQRSLHSTAKTRGDVSFVPGFEGRVVAIETGVNSVSTDAQDITETLSGLATVPEEELVVAQDTDTLSIEVSTDAPEVVETLKVLTDSNLEEIG